MPFQRVLRKIRSNPVLKQEPTETIDQSEPTINVPKTATTPTFPRRVPSTPLFVKNDNLMLSDPRYGREINDLIKLIEVMLDDSL
jgi:hypothetical protein